MDAHAHLLSLGWAGPGNALNAHKSHKGRGGLGLTKPILVAQKRNNFGIGKKQHEPGNDWWLRGFEAALKGVGENGDSTRTSATSSATATPPPSSTNGAYSGKHSGLYGFFVRGQVMQGTIDGDIVTKKGKKRKSDRVAGTTEEDASSSASEEEAVVENISKQKKPKSSNHSQDFQKIEQFMALKEKDLKRNKREARSDPTTEFEQVGAFFANASEKKDKSKKRKSGVEVESSHLAPEEVSSPELKEERKVRRRAERAARKLEKAEREERENKWVALVDRANGSRERDETRTPNSSDEEMERKRRKALKKQRKAEKEALRALQAEAEADGSAADIPQKRKKRRERSG